MESLSEFERQILVVWNEIDGVNVWNQIVLLNVNGEYLSCPIDDDHTISVGVSG